MSRRIVVGVDGSLAARLALDWAVGEAGARGWAVHVVHAWSVGTAADFAWLPAGAVREQSIALLTETVRDTDAAGVEVTWASVEGDPARVLVEAADGAALLVLAAHRGLSVPGRSPGSVTASCLRDATVPVVVVPPTFVNGELDESDHPHRGLDEAIPRQAGAQRAEP